MAQLNDAFIIKKAQVKRFHDRIGTLYGQNLQVSYPLYVDIEKELFYTYTDTDRLIILNLSKNDNNKLVDLPLIGIKYYVKFDKNLLVQDTICAYSHIPNRLPNYYRI